MTGAAGGDSSPVYSRIQDELFGGIVTSSTSASWTVKVPFLQQTLDERRSQMKSSLKLQKVRPI